MKSVSGRISDVKNFTSSGSTGLDRLEFLDFYRSILNNQRNQSPALTVLFYKVIRAEKDSCTTSSAPGKLCFVISELYWRGSDSR